MSNVGQLIFKDGKWIAMYNGNLLASSPRKEYVVRMVETGGCTKARAAGVTKLTEISTSVMDSTVHVDSAQQKQIDRFSIDERFEFMEDFVGMVADGTSPSLIVTGEGGLGKTYTVNSALKANKLKNMSDLGLDDYELGQTFGKEYYKVVKGYSTAKGLYRTLWENRNRVIVFDDCDAVLKDPTAINILKGALDSYDKRIISWLAESFSKDDDLPTSFEFKGGIIFISNRQLHNVDQAVRSRSICVDLSMNTDQKLERMATIIKLPGFEPSYNLKDKKAALEFITEMKLQAREISLRTLISVTKVVARGGEWQKRAEYLLTST